MKKQPLALIIANKRIFPTLDGGSMAMKKLSEILINQNYNLDIVSIAKTKKVIKVPTAKVSTINKDITQIVFEKNMDLSLLNILDSIINKKSYQAIRFYDKNIKDFIQNLIIEKKYEIIIFESIFTTIYLDSLKFSNATKTILRAHNIEHKIWEDLSRSSIIKKIPYLLLSKQIKKMEETIPKNMDYILTLSDYDEKYFTKLFPKKTYNLPVTFNTKTVVDEKIKNSIFHLGAMDWLPNIEGVNWFVKNVLPKVQKNKKNIKIYLAGKNMPKNYFNYNNSSITIEGKIKNAEKYIRTKEIMIVPLFSGSGIRIKILEGMSLGVPIISTSKGAEGIPYENYHNILIADTINEFEKAIYLLIEDKKLAKKIGENGKKLVEAFFSQNFAINQWKKIIN